MSRDCKANVRKVNNAVNSLKNKVNLYSTVTNLNSSSLKAPLKSVVHASAPGKKLSKIGWVIFWIPEPTMISNIIGLPLVAGGKLLDRYYNGTTINHVGKEARKTLNSLEEFFR